MTDVEVRRRSRRAAVLQLAAEEIRRVAGERGASESRALARRLERMAATVLVDARVPDAA